MEGFFIFEHMEIETFYQNFQGFTDAVIDSRKVSTGSLFFAFSGENYNAATQAKQARQDGALAVIVEDIAFEDPSDHIFYKPSTLKFLQSLAKHHRRKLTIPFIGLTGSNGKTTTKELIHAVLAQKYKVQYTQGNLNNHIGVPLTVLSVKTEHDIAVVEMGANHQKEIAELCNICDPDMGYITNFGKAHLEGFGGFEGVIKGKSELYDYLISNSKKILINENDEMQRQKTSGYQHVIGFGRPSSTYHFTAVADGNLIGINVEGKECMSQLTGSYNFSNLSAAASLGLYFGVKAEEICTAISNYTPTNMRSQIVQRNGKTLVLDTYNANPSSMHEALKNFSGFKGSKTVILGDMLELGEKSTAEHEATLALANDLNFDQIITVGRHFKIANNSEDSFGETQELIDYLKKNPVQNDNLLLKGSRGIALEKILDYI